MDVTTMTLRQASRCLTFMLAFVFVGIASAQSPLMPHVEYEKRLRSADMVGPLSTDLFGDSTSLYNGSTEFAVTDIDIPGNDALPVQLRRRFKVESRKQVETIAGFGAWDIDVPYIYGTFPGGSEWNEPSSGVSGERCSKLWLPKVSSSHRVRDIWFGNFMHLPGSGDQEIVNIYNGSPQTPSDGSTYTRSTRDGTRFRCVANGLSNYPGESFVAVTTNGTKYFFNVMARRAGGAMRGTQYRAPLSRVKIYFMATRVQDRHGNGVNYSYGGSKGGQLLYILADDGRRIDLEYDGGETIKRAKAHGRTWSYEYTGGGGALGLARSPLLSKVTLPDLSTWNYVYTLPMQFGGLNPNYTALDVDGGYCAEPDFDPETFTLTITHPSGATGMFELPYTRLHRYGTPANACVPALENPQNNPDGPYELIIPDYFDLYALATKVITGPGLQPLKWIYRYDDFPSGRVDHVSVTCNEPCPSKVVTVKNPDQSLTQYKFGTMYQVNDGQSLGTTVVSPANAVMRSETMNYMVYDEAKTMPFPAEYGGLIGGDDGLSLKILPLKSKTAKQDGVTFEWRVDTSCGTSSGACFDEFARPTRVVKSSSLGFSKTDVNAYYDNKISWVLGQIASVTNANTGIVESQVVYDAKDLPWKTYGFNRVQVMTYDAQGRPASLSDGRDGTDVDTTTFFSDWKRGIPRDVKFPATADNGATKRRTEVNDFGQVTSTIDENGYSTGYVYNDSNGQLKQVNYPTSGTSQWNSKLLDFSKTQSPEYGIDGPHWKRTETTGNARRITYFDAMWRPLVEEYYDSGSADATRRFDVKRYDTGGRVAFQAYPLRTLSSFNAQVSGTYTDYDALGRVTEVRQDSELGVLRTTTAYEPLFRTRVTNPRQQTTTTRYQAYDEPTYEMPVRIDAPEGVSTQIVRDVFGKPTEMVRSGSQ